MAVFVEEISCKKGKEILVAKALLVEKLEKKTMFETRKKSKAFWHLLK